MPSGPQTTSSLFSHVVAFAVHAGGGPPSIWATGPSTSVAASGVMPPSGGAAASSAGDSTEPQPASVMPVMSRTMLKARQRRTVPEACQDLDGSYPFTVLPFLGAKLCEPDIGSLPVVSAGPPRVATSFVTIRNGSVP